MNIKKYGATALFLFGFFLLSFAFFHNQAFADQSGDFIYTIYGSGATVNAYTGTGGEVVIPSTLDGYNVSAIGNGSFANTGITSITIPSSVTSIGANAFYGTGITSITIPSSVTFIGSYAFNNTGITSINIPGSVTSLVDGAFWGMFTLTNVTLNEGLISIGATAFIGTGITSITIPSSVTSIGDNAFNGLSTLTNVTLNEGLISIGANAFNGTGITSITIPSSVTSIGDNAFNGLSTLTNVTLNEGLISIGDTAFNGTGITSINIPGSVTSLVDGAFWGMSTLTNVTLNEGLISIGANAFNGTGITSITIPSSVTSIGDNAFSTHNVLFAYFLGDAPSSMGNSIFDVDATVCYISGNTGFDGVWNTYNTVVLGAPMILPSITTNPATSIKKTSVTLNGNITNDGGIVMTRGFQYGIDTNYITTTTENGSFTNGSYTKIISRLACNTTYHYRSYTKNFIGTSYGNDMTFMTMNCSSLDKDQILYGSDGAGSNSDTKLYVLDSTNGDIIATIGYTGHNINGMAFNPKTGILYGSTSNNDTDGGKSKSLFTIDTETGLATWLGTIKDGNNKSWSFPDLAFRSDGILFGWGNDGNNGLRDLYIINTTCPNNICLAKKFGNLVEDLTLDINSWEIGGGGIAFDSKDNLYLFEGEADLGYILKVDSVTGALLDKIAYANPSENEAIIMAAKFDGNDTLFASRSNWGGAPADLVKIDVNTGYIDSLGENETMPYMTAITFKPIPTPEPESTPVVHHTSSGSSASSRYTNLLKNGNIQAAEAIKKEFPNQINSQTVTPLTIVPSTIQNITRVLKVGLSGEDVKSLQTYLNSHNYNCGIVDGKFGPKTKATVILFQKAHNLIPDGIVGSKTRGGMK